MIKFIIKGLYRDKGRSRLPVIVVAIGVTLTVFMHSYLTGFLGDTIEMNARFTHGHLKVYTNAYAENMSQAPNDLSLINVSELINDLKTEYPDIRWSPRITFGGLIDAPDENGETRAQGSAAGLAMDFLTADSKEAERLEIEKSLVRGNLISNPGEALISELFSQKLQVNPGDVVTFIGSTMNGSMTMHNFIIAGTVRFGTEALDRGAVIADIEDMRFALDMYDAAGEILGFLPGGYYDDDEAMKIAKNFNSKYNDVDDEFSPLMNTLGQQGTMGQFVAMADSMATIVSFVFILAMALVLWNAGLLGGLRRYGEFGIRLAMGEEKKHVYISLIYESIFVGIAGTIAGTALGLAISWLLQTYGLDISKMMEGASLMMPSTIRARITATDYYLGFIPGLISTVLGSALAGIGIFKRKTSQLFKELEA